MIGRIDAWWQHLLLCGGLLLAASCSPQASEFSSPTPSLSAREVVELQLAAFRRAGSSSLPDEGQAALAAAYAFASPENKSQVGDLDTFAEMISSGYGDMLTHTQAVTQIVRQSDSEAAISVALLMSGEEPHHYLFLLRKQDEGELKGCWMTDAVLPLQPDNPRALQVI